MASINIVSSVKDTSVGQFLQADVVLDAQGSNLNAVSGNLIIPANFQVMEVLDGNSSIGLWIERPTTAAGDVRFSGVIPGGFSGSHGVLFSVRLRATGIGNSQLAIDEGKILLNDGKGTETPFSTKPLGINVTKSGLLSMLPVTVKDTDPPENFTPVIGHETSVYDGQWFLAFSTQDKSSGIDHYEVKEGWRAWESGSSPFLLRDQSLKSEIFVKAIDLFGNARIAVVPAANPLAWYEHGTLWGILVVVLLGGVVLWRRSHKRKAV